MSINSSNNKTPTISAVKGHLVTKSSPLATESCKLEKQFLTAQNMASHYKRVINAKPSIDTSPPKSLVTSQKARDRAKREMLRYSTANNALERAKSADTGRNSVIEDKTESKSYTVSQSRTVKSAQNEEIKPRTLPNQKKLQQEMANLMQNFTKHNTNRVAVYKPREKAQEEPTTQFINPLASTRSFTNSEKNSRNLITSLLFNSQNHDPKLVGNPALKAMSVLVSGHNYDVLDNHAHKFKQPDKEFQPRIKNLDSSSKLKASSCYQPPRRRKKSNASEAVSGRESVAESIKSIEENLNKNDTSKINKSVVSIDDDEDIDFESIRKAKDRSGGLNISNMSTTRPLDTSQSSLKRAAEKEEELKYLEFIKEVTDDILARGITSNRVINNCFDYHVKNNRNRLNEKKMRELLENLREDIGIPNEDETEIGTAYYQTINKAMLLDREKNKENFDDNVATNYLTLRKFGYTNQNSNESYMSLNNAHINIDENNNDDLTRQNSTQSKSYNNKKLFDEYGTQIIKNIQSIRRNSNDSGENRAISENNSRKNSNESIKSLGNSPKPGSILKKSRSQSSELSRKDSKDSDKGEKITRSLVRQKSQESNENSDDDDEDLFISKKPAQSLNTSKSSNRITDNSPKLNDSKNNFMKKNNSLNKSEYAEEDALFNDDYGPEEPNDDNNDSKTSDSNSEDDFDNFLKTKSMKKIQERKFSSDSNQSDKNDRSKSPLETPTPMPRKSMGTSKENERDDTSDEDSF